MPTPNPYPLNIPAKVNSPELLAWFQQFGIDKYLSAEEINKMSAALQFLYENLGGGALSQSGITTLGTITIVDDEVTFEDFAWKIDGVDYAQVAPITRTLPFATEGMYRTHTAYFTTTNDIDIAVGPEDSVVTTEPDIPEGTLRMRAFNVFGEVITVGPGVPAPFDLLAFDEFTGDTDGWMWIKVLGYDFKIKRSTLIAAQDFQAVMEAGSEWNIDADNYVKFYPDGGLTKEIRGRGFGWAFYDIASLSGIYKGYSVSTNFDDTLNAGGSVGVGNDAIEGESCGPILTKSLGTDSILVNIENPIFGSSQIVVTIPSTPGRLATENYVNELLEGLKTKQPVRVATTDSIFLNDVQLIDGVVLVENDRILVKDQSDAELNGIYIVKEAADWVRSTDANTATELTNAVVSVLEGTANGGSTYRQVTTSIVLETSNIVWQSFGTSVPDATSTTKGKAKLYTSLGSNTDGAVDQNTVNSALALKANLQNVEQIIRSKANGTFGSHTGDTAETVIAVIDINANEFEAGDWSSMYVFTEKNGTAGTLTIRLRAGVNGNTSDALISTSTATGPTSRYLSLSRVSPRFLTGNLLNIYLATAAALTDINTSSINTTSVSLTPSSAWKLTITAQLGSSGETVSLTGYRIGKIKSF